MLFLVVNYIVLSIHQRKNYEDAKDYFTAGLIICVTLDFCLAYFLLSIDLTNESVALHAVHTVALIKIVGWRIVQVAVVHLYCCCLDVL